MGWRGMGDSSGVGSERTKKDDRRGWRKDDAESQDQLERFLEGGKASRFQRTLPLPSAGDRFGELTVSHVEFRPRGGVAGVWVNCSCGAPQHRTDRSNLVRGKTTRCRK